MATRMASRYISRRFSSGGKVLSEEEKAAENVYIKKVEQEKLQKLAQKGPKAEEKPGAGSSETVAGSVAKAAGGGAESSSKPGVSNDKFKNYAVVAGLVTLLGAGGWYYLSKDKKAEEVRD